jgi:2-oxoglutarate ferredoxin oxidoreductase subunit delta
MAMGKAKKKYRIQPAVELCKGCRLCVEFCPKKVLALTDGEINEKGFPFVKVEKGEECVGCLTCTTVCPDGVIEIFEVDSAS